MRLLLVLVFALNITACAPIPYKEEITPAISGKVVDAATGKGIEDVAIEVHPWDEPESASSGRSDKDGNFVVDKAQRWQAVFWLLGGDPVMYGYVRIVRDGYSTAKREYFLSTGELFIDGGPHIKLGEIWLSPK